MRIGELSRRTGVSDHVLRAWERRYSLLAPHRTPAGYRLYGAEDEHRVRQMQGLLRGGLATSEAARTVLAGTADDVTSRVRLPAARASGVRRLLLDAVRRFDDQAATAVLDDLAAEVGVEATIADVVLPLLRAVGDGWQRGTTSIAHEHVASQLVRRALARWAGGPLPSGGTGPAAVLACPPGEQHDLALLALSVLLRRRRWTVHYLGPDTPLDEATDVASQVGARVVVLAATDPGRFLDLTAPSAGATTVPLLLAGAGATLQVGTDLGHEVTSLAPLELADALHDGVLPTAS